MVFLTARNSCWSGEACSQALSLTAPGALSTPILNLAKLTRFSIKSAGSSVKIKHVCELDQSQAEEHPVNLSCAAPHQSQPMAAPLFISVACSEEG